MANTLRKFVFAAAAWLALSSGAFAADATPAPPLPAAKDQAPPPSSPAPSSVVLPPEVTDTISKVVGTMEGAEKTLTAIKSVDTDLGRLRDDIDGVIAKATQTADSLRPRLADLRGQIDRLGPAPDKGAPPEMPSAASERSRLDGEAAEVSGAIKTLEVTWWRARQAIDKITDLRLQLFVQSLTERMASPLFPSLWTNLMRDSPAVSWRFDYNIKDWFGSVARKWPNVIMLLAAAALIYTVLKGVIYGVTRYRAAPGTPAPSFFERAASASWVGPMRALPAAMTAFALYAGFDYLGLLYYPTAAPAGAALLRASLIYIGVAAMVSAVFSPGQSARRLVPLSTRAARRISRLLKVLAAIYAADLFSSSFGQILYFPLSISVVQSLIASLGFAAVLTGLLLTPFDTEDADGNVVRAKRLFPRWIKLPLWLTAGAIIVSCLLGYVALGRFMAQQLVMTGIIALVATLLILAIRAFTRERSSGRNALGVLLEDGFGLDAIRRDQVTAVTEAALTLCVGLVVLPVLLLQWGFSNADIRDWTKSLLFGFEIGQFRISLVKILLGIAIFSAIMFATRMIQRQLRDSVLHPPRMDAGIAHSIDTAVGYAGTILAALVAVSYAGFDVTSLAIVAGALSVGIGFGLQSIVNNFVSGLILLIERPIKVGDWVVVGNEQGNVRRISVRSTEIETFERASLIVPNSELVAGRVLNWTHRSAQGRINVKFNAGPDADPRRVIAILTDCARRHPDILKEPPPLAVFEGYTRETTEFSLRVLLPDITRGLKIQSDLRIAVFEAMRASRIDLPITMVTEKTPQPAA